MAAAASSPKTRRKGKPGATSLGQLVDQIGARSFRKQGFVHSQVITEWARIVGPVLAELCLPEQLRFPPGRKRGATLRVRAESGAALELQHQLPLVLDRVNTYFGYQAVEKISIRQGPLPPIKKTLIRPKERPLSAAQRKSLDNQLKSVTDQRLKDALSRLGTHVINSKIEK